MVVFSLIGPNDLFSKESNNTLIEDKNFNYESGSYLSWIQAEKSGNSLDKSFFLSKIKNRLDDRTELKKAFFSALYIDEWEISKELAYKILEFEPSNFFANIVIATNLYLKNDFKGANKFIKKITNNDIDRNFLNVISSWVYFSENKKKEAIDLLEIDIQNCIPLNCLHAGLQFDLLGSLETAKTKFDFLQKKNSNSFRVLELLLIFYEKIGEEQSTRDILENFKKTGFDFIDLELIHNQDIFNPITEPAHGLAEAYFNIAGWFYENRLYRFSAYFSNLGLKVRPDFSSLKFLLANIYEKQDNNLIALKNLESFNEKDLYYLKAEKLKLKILNDLDKTKEIVKNLRSLVKEFPNRIELKILLADSLRHSLLYEESINYYNEILNEVNEPKDELWKIFYSRGISYERLKKWKLAEKDLLKALDLNPEAPFVLNYLGYSWLERGVKLEQALDLILSAVELEPNDAYIIDSLGWAYFLLGDFKKSIDILEHALRLLPYDPTLNDHLGDAYWKVGRKKEALSQWKRVLIYEPKEELKKSVLSKISVGL